jgi:protein-S-isoprenylcysteine O-methyltransferase Ste14
LCLALATQVTDSSGRDNRNQFSVISEAKIMWSWIVFCFLTLFLVYISRASLRSSRSHGFYRFFAWELILALFMLNEKFWFQNPFAWYQILAWTLLFVALIPLAFGVYSLRSRGKASANRESDPSLFVFEKTTQLVTSGIYKYIRHPLYSSLLLLTWGMFFKLPSITGGALTVVATLFLFATAKADEAECIQFFGAEYKNYMQKTKRFIPLLF